MNNIFTTLFVAALLTSCNSGPPKVDVAKASEELKNTDQAWSDMTVKEGFGKTIETYYTEDVVFIQSNPMPAKGRAGIIKIREEHPDTWKGLSWTNEKAEVAQSGDLGYTWGKWQQKYTTAAGTDTIAYGLYSTVWKKQPDGRWQAVLDEATSTGKPE